jgi:acyl carrier protein
VLNVDATLLSPDSHFFQSGGSSLDTIALISQIKGTLNIVITQDEIFLHPKIESLALRLRDIQATSKEAPSLEPIDGSSTWGRIFPASHGQEQMISCWEMAPTMYNMPTTIEFTRESIDIAILHEAFLLVIRNQHSLRTLVKVDTSSNSMHQYVLPVCDADKCVELKSLQAKNQDEARAIIERESSFVFPLYDVPVVRAVVVKVANGSDLLLLNQHHVGSDGWSRTILRRQLLKSYMALRKKTVLPE